MNSLSTLIGIDNFKFASVKSKSLRIQYFLRMPTYTRNF